MPSPFRSPGVYGESLIAAPPPGFTSGEPAFVGLTTVGIEPTRLARFSDFQGAITPLDGSWLEAAVRGFFSNGGAACWVVGRPAGRDRETALLDALQALETVDAIDLIAVPDASLVRSSDGRTDTEAMLRIQRAALTLCGGDAGRFAVLETPPGSTLSSALAFRQALTTGMPEPCNGALYHPWLRSETGAAAPPCGHVAGLYSALDNDQGPGRAPAGAALADVLDVETRIDARTQDTLNQAGINAIRVFPGRGVRVWGARTLSRQPEWLYINIRRIVLTLGRWIEANLGWTTFEPNTPSTWARVERALTSRLMDLWRSGALVGIKPSDAFSVRCTRSAEPGADDGRMLVEINLAPAAPVEFITYRLTLLSQTTP